MSKRSRRNKLDSELKPYGKDGDFRSRKEWKYHAWKKTAEEIVKNQKGKGLDMLNFILTEKEKDQIIKRIMIMIMLKEGRSYKEISKTLFVSPQTISLIKDTLKDNKTYESYYSKKGKLDEKGEEIKKSEITLDSLPLLPLFYDDFKRMIDNNLFKQE